MRQVISLFWILSLLWTFQAHGNPLPCHQVIPFSPHHFAPSGFGLAHAERPGQAQYSEWSAETANQIYQAIENGESPQKIFELAVLARQEFAQVHENVENPEEDYGAPRESRSNYIVGEDMMGLSSITLDLVETEPLPEGFENWPHQWWKNIALNKDRTKLVDEIIRHTIATENLSRTDTDLLILDRHYMRLDRQVFKSSSTKFQRVQCDKPPCPYLVSTLNVPKPDIQPIIEDVYLRIELALKSDDLKEAKALLAHAMYGFFNAMPYYRGSAAIGRIVFSALYTKIEGRPVTIDPEIDIKALLQYQGEFVDNFIANN